jgi:enoyl-CoA hydratase/carnithine racemase
MAQEVVKFQSDGNIRRLILNRPELMNALGDGIIEGLEEGLRSIAADESARVVVIEGAGGNFSSGADMNWLNTQSGSSVVYEAMRLMSKLILTIRRFPLPVITKVRGVAVGAGANLALTGDFVLAVEDSRFIQPFVNLGAVLDGGGTYFLPRLVGRAKAMELALLGEPIDGKAAEAAGLIYKSVPDKELDDAVDTLAATLSKKPPKAMALIKESLEMSLDMSLAEALEWEASHQSIRLQTEEHKEAVRSFLKSRGKI